jgi:hypothetical protein
MKAGTMSTFYDSKNSISIILISIFQLSIKNGAQYILNNLKMLLTPYLKNTTLNNNCKIKPDPEKDHKAENQYKIKL